MVERLLKYPNVDLTACAYGYKKSNNEALFKAIENGHWNIVQLLLQVPAISSTVNYSDALKLAITKNRYDIVDGLLKWKKDEFKNEMIDYITEAIKCGKIDIFERLFEEPSSLEESLKYASAALVKAAECGHRSIAYWLLDHVAIDVSTRQKAFNFAVMANKIPIMDLLLKFAGKSMNHGRIDAGAENNHAVLVVTRMRDLPMLQKLLEEPSVDASDGNNKALISAISNGDVRIVKRLLEIPKVRQVMEINKNHAYRYFFENTIPEIRYLLIKILPEIQLFG